VKRRRSRWGAFPVEEGTDARDPAPGKPIRRPTPTSTFDHPRWAGEKGQWGEDCANAPRPLCRAPRPNAVIAFGGRIYGHVCPGGFAFRGGSPVCRWWGSHMGPRRPVSTARSSRRFRTGAGSEVDERAVLPARPSPGTPPRVRPSTPGGGKVCGPTSSELALALVSRA